MRTRTCFRVSRVFLFKQRTAYEMRISDWSSDVCSSDLGIGKAAADRYRSREGQRVGKVRRARIEVFLELAERDRLIARLVEVVDVIVDLRIVDIFEAA